MSLSLALLPAAALAVVAWYWWRGHRRNRARQEHLDALIQARLDGICARQRLAIYEARARQAIQAEIRQARRELQPWRWSPYD